MTNIGCACLLAVILPEPPVVNPTGLRDGEVPVKVESVSRVASSNGLYRVITTELKFSNPNKRVMAAELEFPLPEDGTVCGYRLEINGEMVPGVVCEKEKARVSFENEQRKGADPGLVEKVKGNVWKTRIYPIPVGGERKAEVSYLTVEESPAATCPDERWGDYVYSGTSAKSAAAEVFDPKTFVAGWVMWDASLSRKGKTAADIEALKAMPERGDWTLVVFRNVVSEPRQFKVRDELIAAVEAEPCDGGTDIAALLEKVPATGGRKCLFSDEIDTLALAAPHVDDRSDFVFASRPKPKARAVTVTRRRFDAAKDSAIAEGRLLATAWAANRIADLSAQAEARKDEFLALGRAFGVASPVTSLIVLENLQQWLDNGIEPPAELSVHAQWVKAKAEQDDQIRAKERRAEFEKRLLELWKERVEWWKSPKPKKVTPKSGLFDGVVNRLSRAFVRNDSVAREAVGMAAPSGAPVPMCAEEKAEVSDKVTAPEAEAKASVRLAAWDPKTPYIDALKAAVKGGEYETYLAQREKFGNSPAFYLDCAGWFFKNSQTAIAKRVISNLCEFKLEDVALWRTMGWRLREAAAYDEAVVAFRHALRLRGEEGQSRRDLALVLSERGKDAKCAADVEEALKLFAEAAFTDFARRSARRSNDLQVAIVALEELNALIAWCEAQEWKDGRKPAVPTMDEAFRRDLPMDLRIVMSWDTDETDIDIHVLEPDGEEAYYSHRRTSQGGFVGEDVTTGYGPEEYLRKEADKGVYKVLSNYFASHQQALTGATTVSATVYTNWARKGERRQVLTLRLDKPKDKHFIGEVTIE